MDNVSKDWRDVSTFKLEDIPSYTRLEKILVKYLMYTQDHEVIATHLYYLKYSYAKGLINVVDYNLEIQKTQSEMRVIEEKILGLIREMNYLKLTKTKERKLNNIKVTGLDIKIKDFRVMTVALFNKVLPKVCCKCGSTERLHIHHIKYKYPIEEKDLMRLCQSCHSKHHQSLRHPSPPKCTWKT